MGVIRTINALRHFAHGFVRIVSSDSATVGRGIIALAILAQFPTHDSALQPFVRLVEAVEQASP